MTRHRKNITMSDQVSVKEVWMQQNFGGYTNSQAAEDQITPEDRMVNWILNHNRLHRLQQLIDIHIATTQELRVLREIPKHA